jgi:hypothetical protein
MREGEALTCCLSEGFHVHEFRVVCNYSYQIPTFHHLDMRKYSPPDSQQKYRQHGLDASPRANQAFFKSGSLRVSRPVLPAICESGLGQSDHGISLLSHSLSIA